MKKRDWNLNIIITLLISLLMTSCGFEGNASNSIPVDAKAGDLINLEPCTYKAGKVKYEAECGTLVVPENRNAQNSRLITLPVIQVLALDGTLSDPIFWFEGGPGNTNMKFFQLEGLIDNHNIVMVGYRGVDGSVVLDCPEMSRAAKGVGDDLLSEVSLANFGESMTECAQRLRAEGVDLDGYSIPEVVEDMEDARNALDYGQVNLLSGSYGTRVAMFYAWMYPDSLNRSIMVSVNPPGHFVWEPEEIDRLINYDAGLCSADPNCSARTSDLAETIRNVSKNMTDRWLVLPINPGKVKFISQFMLFHRGTAAAAFDAYLAAEKGDPSGLALMSLMYDFMAPSLVTWGEWTAKGGIDYDPTRDWINDMNPPDSILGSPTSLLVGGALQLSDGWPIAPMPETFYEVQPSNVETLLVGGSIDYSTPSQNATKELLPSLTNGEQVILSEFGHVTDVFSFQPEATTHLLVNFYKTGEVDDSQFVYQPMNYKVGIMSFPLLAKVLVGVMLLVIILLISLTWKVIRKFRNRMYKKV